MQNPAFPTGTIAAPWAVAGHSALLAPSLAPSLASPITPSLPPKVYAGTQPAARMTDTRTKRAVKLACELPFHVEPKVVNPRTTETCRVPHDHFEPRRQRSEPRLVNPGASERCGRCVRA